MKCGTRLLLVVATAIRCAACGTDPSDTAPSVPETLLLTPDRSFTLTFNDVTFPVVAKTDACLDWTGLEVPSSGVVDEINLVLLDLPADCALFSFAQGDFRQSDVRLGAFLQQPTGTRACLTDFTWFGAESFSCEADSTWMVILVAQNEYMAVVLDPCAGTTETEVSLAGLDWGASPFTADFSAANPFTVDASTAPILDWSGFSTTSLGEPFTPEEARYLRVLNTPIPVDDLAVSWLDAWANPTVSWQAMVAWLSSADLAACKDSDDAHFPGFTSEGTWLVALMADRCPPSAMAVVEVKD